MPLIGHLPTVYWKLAAKMREKDFAVRKPRHVCGLFARGAVNAVPDTSLLIFGIHFCATCLIPFLLDFWSQLASIFPLKNQ